MIKLNERANQTYNKNLDDLSNEQLYALLLDATQEIINEQPLNQGKKKLYYISAEFLLGKLLDSNLINLGIKAEVEAELAAHDKTLAEIEAVENEPSLGNGGLGRLAACFMDSVAALGLNGDGVGLNYHFGLFQQYFEANQQHAKPDAWLSDNSWLRPTDTHYTVDFGDFSVNSTLYEIDVPGYKQASHNRIRLFDINSVDESIIEAGGIDFDKTEIAKNLTLFLYPDDSDYNGRLLRVYQQYFMVSNAAQLMIEEAIERGSNLHDLADYAVVQINDTHPTMVIPELIRLLTEKYDLAFDEAVEITSNIVAFTNHTILAEALEKWPLEDIRTIAPKLAVIIEQLAERVAAKYDDPAVAVIDENQTVHMAHLAIHYGFSINGVSELHTNILRRTELQPFYAIYPEKFNNKTNGITFRRWLMSANPALNNYLNELIGTEWQTTGDLTPLADYQNDEMVTGHLFDIKQSAKLRLAEHLRTTKGVAIDPNSIIDVQIKRMHEYKRQQMLALYIIKKYMMIKAGHIPKRPITIVFGGKAAPAYIIAQDIIHLLLSLSELIANDPEVSPHLKVVFVENYNVTEAEYLIPAADISEQISLASKEASGTGNMKFMLNGALTICTFDGANIEIADQVGRENIYTFGESSETVERLYQEDAYHPEEYYAKDSIKPLVDFIVSDELLAYGVRERLERLYQDIKSHDYFMGLLDLESFIDIKERVYEDYEDRGAWDKKSLLNIANAGFFSSDRVIAEYNEDIWHLDH